MRGKDSWLTIRAKRQNALLKQGPEAPTDDKFWILLNKRKVEIVREASYSHLIIPGGRGFVTGDAPQVDPEHQQHGDIAWFDCVRHSCPDQFHQAQKLYHGVIPCSEGPVRRVHEWASEGEWDIAVERQGEGTPVARIRIRATSPNNCLSPHARWEDCPIAHCHAHMYAKLGDWHKARDARLQTRKKRQMPRGRTTGSWRKGW